MKIEVKIDDQVVFSQGKDGYVLMPCEECERHMVQTTLISALASLSGVMPQSNTSSKDIDLGEHYSKNELCQADRKDGVVVHLTKRLDNRNSGTTPE